METWTSPVADFDVRVTSPTGMQVFATGANVGKGHWRAAAVRDFALAAGQFKVARRTVHVPGRVVVTVASASTLDPRATLDTAAQALTSLSKRYAPYPWSTYTVVIATDRRSLGQEYPTIVFVSPDVAFFALVHETAHQWFYSLVGNNQARDPWLDEPLAEWASARLTGAIEPEVATYIPADVRNHLGEPMAFWGPLPFRPLVWDGLYLQGVQALASFGDDDRVDCALQTYVHDKAYRTALPGDLLAALRPTFADAEAVLTGYGVHF